MPRRANSICLGLHGRLDAEKLLRLYPAEGIHGTDLVRDAAVLAVLLPFSVWWALRAIHRAEPACT